MTGTVSFTGTYTKIERVKQDVAAIVDELADAMEAFPPFNSAHEGYAVIAEELDELWAEIKANKGGTRVTDNKAAMRREAVQVGAMVMRFLHDVCGPDSVPECWFNEDHRGHWTRDCPDHQA